MVIPVDDNGLMVVTTICLMWVMIIYFLMSPRVSLSKKCSSHCVLWLFGVGLRIVALEIFKVLHKHPLSIFFITHLTKK